jgi:hypothetical protein
MKVKINKWFIVKLNATGFIVKLNATDKKILKP